MHGRARSQTNRCKASPTSDTVHTETVAVLRERFEAFRREHKRGARIPLDLRTEVAAALSTGVPPSRIQEACKVSWSQLSTWRLPQEEQAKSSRSAADSKSDSMPGPRVFTVEDESPVLAQAPGGGSGSEALELRFGQWSVSVRLSPAPEVE